MSFFKLKYRIIESEGKYSVQIYEGVSNRVFWTCPTWFDDKETVIADVQNVIKYVEDKLVHEGYNRAQDLAGETMLIADGEDKRELKEQSGKFVDVFVSPSKDEVTGKFKYTIMTTDGDVIVGPTGSYDSMQDMLADLKQNKEAITDIVDKWVAARPEHGSLITAHDRQPAEIPQNPFSEFADFQAKRSSSTGLQNLN